MPKLEVRGKLDALCRGDVAIRHEDEVGYRAAREDGTTDELADQVDAAMLVGDGHDDAVRDEEDGANAERQEEAIPWQVDRVAT